MNINFSKIEILDSENKLNPREIFLGLQNKPQEYLYPRDVQSEVWKQWFNNREEKNTVIKMNTVNKRIIVVL